MVARRKRLDELLVDLGYFADTRRALGPIMAGDVTVGGVRVTKAGSLVATGAEVSVKGFESRYASRGGYKLEHALDVFGIDVAGLTVLDAGASTGGFTDCLLQRGAARVYAVDVGYGQMRGRLAADERVVVLERTNISDLLAKPLLDRRIDLCTMDLSYLSLLKAVPIVSSVVGESDIICLVKPLYEGLREEHKADPAAILAVAERLLSNLAEAGFYVTDIDVSPVLGGRGAAEFLILIGSDASSLDLTGLLDKLRRGWVEHPPTPDN